MKLLVISQSRNRAGRTVQVRKDVVGDWIRVGRSASSEILLADPRIALNQGLIVDRNGPVYTQGEAGTMSGSSLTAVSSERLSPGKSIDVGPFRLTAIVAPEGYSGAITVELVRPAEKAAPEFLSRADTLTLASLRLPKRGIAVGLFIAIAVVFLLLPAGRVLGLPWGAPEAPGIASDRFWNPGPLMLAHQQIEQKCEACHEIAFRHVRDGACLECHSRIGHHVGQGQRPAALFEGTRCAQCHRDHKGVKTTHRDDDRFCADCHRDLRSRVKDAQAQGASDFAKDHPAFRLALATPNGVQRVRQGSGPLQESSNLVFAHAVHVDAAGIRHPDKGKVKLECASCHAADSAGRGFERVSMAKHCQECHRLEFEPAVTSRQVPHGRPAEAVRVVREFYSNLALNGTSDSFEKAFGVPGSGLLRRTGAPSESDRLAALALAEGKSAQVSRELFGNRLANSGRKSERVADEIFEVRICRTCHEVTQKSSVDGPQWDVAPVRQSTHWMPHARFNHKSHAQAKCAGCHDVAKSKRSADVAMPTIEGCRECHGGSRPAAGKVTSNCLLCHGFHEQKHPWDPQFRPKASTRTAGAN